MPCFTERRGRAGARADRDAAGAAASTCAGSSRTSSTRCNPAWRPAQTLGASYAPGDGYLDPPRNVLAYTAALFTAGVEVRERTAFTGLTVDGGRVTGVRDQRRGHRDRAGRAHRRPAPGRPSAGRPAPGSRPAARGTRSSSPSRTPTWRPTGCRWSSTWRPGIYWRPCEGGVMWGMSNPDEPPGVATRVRLALLREGARAGGRRCCR